ncbi:MAG: hypothetical protein WA966_07215 [Ornithinimicrobium sp.]
MNEPRDLDRDLLQIYLADHQAGARGVMNRLDQMTAYTDLPIAPVIAQLHAEVREEFAWVAALVTRLEVSPGRVKQSGARVGELLGRLKLNGRWRRRSPLTPVVELEMLSAAVVGKQRLFETLTDLRDDLPVNPEELANLSARAERQLSDITDAHERLRRTAFKNHEG